jgi:D-glycero-D-manno-heptose 1,7-bisphosphate phosphatase
VSDVPKPLAPVAGRPFLDYLTENLAKEGIADIVFMTGHRADQIRDRFGDGKDRALSIAYSHETEPLGTGGALRLALKSYAEDDELVLVLNGDSYFDIPIRSFLKVAEESKAGATIALKYLSDVGRYGTVEFQDGRIHAFKEKDESLDQGIINAGVYALRAGCIRGLSHEGAFSLERDVFPLMASRGDLAGAIYPGKFIDIGVESDYNRANRDLPSWLGRAKIRAVFLDRDGIINKDRGYTGGADSIEFVEGSLDFMRALAARDYGLIIVTNQAGIAKGKLTDEDHRLFMDRLLVALKQKGIGILGHYYCPFHPEASIAGYRRASFDRKPAPGMVLRAADEHFVDLAASWMIGDKESDRIELPYLRSLILKGDYEVAAGPWTFGTFDAILRVIDRG